MVLSSEIYPLRLRAQAVAVGFALNRMASGGVAMSFLSIYRAVTVAGAFTAFAVVSALSMVFVHLFVPETSGKTLEHIESLFSSGGVTMSDFMSDLLSCTTKLDEPRVSYVCCAASQELRGLME
jgi:hypothetical protein